MTYRRIPEVKIVQDTKDSESSSSRCAIVGIDTMDNREFSPLNLDLADLDCALAFEKDAYSELQSRHFDEEAVAEKDEEWVLSTDGLADIDFGMGSVVAALSLFGCSTIASCRGRCLDDAHSERYPLVLFFATPEVTTKLLTLSKQAGVGLRSYLNAFLLYSDDLLKMHEFASRLRPIVATCRH